MKTQHYTCKKCNRRYEYNADVGYSRDNICGPFCDGLLRGESKSQSRIAELEAEIVRLREVLRALLVTGISLEALLADEPTSVYIHPEIWAELKEHRGHLRRGLTLITQPPQAQESESE